MLSLFPPVTAAAVKVVLGAQGFEQPTVRALENEPMQCVGGSGLR